MSDGEKVFYTLKLLNSQSQAFSVPNSLIAYSRMAFCLTIKRSSLTAVRHIDRAIKSRADKR